MSDRKNFKDVAATNGLKKATIDKLIGEDFDSIEVVKLMTPLDIEELGSTKGQTRTLQLWVKSLNVSTPDPAPLPVSESGQSLPATASHGNDADLFMTDAEVEDSWNVEDNAAQSGRTLFIHDFVSRVSHDDQERAVCTQGGTQLILRSTRQKPAPETVTLPQWVSANARIMAKLIKDNTLKSNEEILDYLEYVMDLGDYAQVIVSVYIIACIMYFCTTNLIAIL